MNVTPLGTRCCTSSSDGMALRSLLCCEKRDELRRSKQTRSRERVFSLRTFYPSDKYISYPESVSKG